MGSNSFPPGTSTISGDLCTVYPSHTTQIRIDFGLIGNPRSCQTDLKSTPQPPCPQPASCPSVFTDLVPDDPFHAAVISLHTAGIVSGYSDGTFRPASPVTRAQAAKILVLAFGLPVESGAGTTAQPPFADVPGTHPLAPYIMAAQHARLITGYPDGTFRPDTPLTRGQWVKMLVEASGLTLINPAAPSFRDVAPNTPFYRYIETARAQGLLSGYDDATFRPDVEITRGQTAQIIYSAIGPADR